jgi:hypothetical protein
MFQGKGLKRGSVARVVAFAVAIAAAGCAKAPPLKVEKASASTTFISQGLAATLTLRNVSGKKLHLFIDTPPTATDDAGHAYTSTSLAGPDIGGIAVCWSGSHCLTEDKAKTESNATAVEPNGVIVVNVAFCCKVSGTALPSKASATLQIKAREAGSGGAWESLSVAAPEFRVTAKKRYSQEIVDGL